MKSHVEFCENSTITEAWAVILGAPGEVRDSDVGALENFASKDLGDFQLQPSFVVVEKKQDEKIVPPYWHRQLSYQNGKYLARLGHRYLSVHFIKMGDEKYDKYEYSLAPQIDIWLDAYAEMVSGRKEPHLVERVGFGYVNLFKLPLKNFDLSQYLKISFGTGAEAAKNGLSTLEINFRLSFSENDSTVEVSISVFPESPESDVIVMLTRVEAQKVADKGCSFSEEDQILNLVRDAKEAAKSVFFDLATEETRTIMGAKYDSSAS